MNKVTKKEEVKLLMEEYQKMIFEAIDTGLDGEVTSFELILGAAQTGMLAASLSASGLSTEEIQKTLNKMAKEVKSMTEKVDKSTLPNLNIKDKNDNKKKTFH